MKKFFLLSILVILLPLIFSFTNNTIEHAFAQNPLTGTRSLAGDEVCGATAGSKCTLDNAKSIVKTTLYYILGLGTILLGVVIIFRILAAVKAYYVDNNAGALKKAGSDLFNSIIGFIVIVLVIGGVFVALLTFLGVKADFLKVFSDALVPTAYAQAAPCTPGEANCGFTNPLGVSSLYDFVLLVVRLFIRWFIYPGIIVMWIWSGFAFVTAQGRPEQLKKAKSWLVWAFVATVLIFMTEGFLFALRGTVNQVLPGTSTQTTDTTIYQPPAGTTGAVCTMADGTGNQGMIGADGVCSPSARGQTGATNATSCAGLAEGTVCTVAGGTGTCTSNELGVFGCYTARRGDPCRTSSGEIGSIGSNYQCQAEVQTRSTGILRGGSCRISAECASNSCVNALCQ